MVLERAYTVTVLPEPLSLPVVLENCIHEASAVAFHITGFPHVLVVFSVINCPGGSGCKRVAVNDRWDGAACRIQEVRVVGVDVGMDTGVGVPAPGVVVPVELVLVPVCVPVPRIAMAEVGIGVPATGEMAGVRVSPAHVVEPACGERTIPVPVMAAMSVSDRV